MALSLVGAAAADGTTIAIPGTEAPGDMLIIFAFRSATTAPSLPALWTSLATASAGASSFRIGWKLCTTAGDSSGTWTNATGLICHVYRGISTSIAIANVLRAGTASTGTGTTVTYGAATQNQKRASWVAAFSATKTLDSNLQTAPTGMTNQCNTVGAAVEYAGFDTNGIYNAGEGGGFVSTNVAVAGTSAEWRSYTLEIQAESGTRMNNYQFSRNLTSGQGKLSFTERIR